MMQLPTRRMTGLILTALIVCALHSEADDWPQFRGINRNGQSAETGWLSNWPPSTVWTQRIGEGYSGIAVVGDRAYTMGWSGDQEHVRCFNPYNGALVWKHSYAAGTVEFNGPRATPTIDGNQVYTYGHEGRLSCYDRMVGTQVWSKVISSGRPYWGLSGSPLIEGEMVIINAGDGGYALNKRTGAEVWSNPHSRSWAAGYSSPFAYGSGAGRTIVMLNRAGLLGLNAQTGATNFYYEQDSHYNVCDPIIYTPSNTVYFCERGTHSVCRSIKLGSGKLTDEAWHNWNMRSECSTPVLIGNYLYGFDYGDMVCMDIRDGSNRWVEVGLLSEEATIVAADGKLIVLTIDGYLGIVEASPAGYDAGGRAFVKLYAAADLEEWRTPPTFANGKIYCRSQQGTIVCLQVADLWYEAEDLGNNWKFLSWLGIFNAGTPPWIFHLEHAWMYPVGNSSTDLWLYTLDMGWLWTSRPVYPNVYHANGGTFLFYVPNSKNPRLFWNWTAGAWEAH